MVLNNYKKSRGFSIIEVLIVSAVMLLVFGGLLMSFKYSLELISHSRAKLTALTVANDTMEYIRSLSYNAVGTVSGIPSGAIPQVSTTTLNGILFTKTVLVEYIDDDADGVGASDGNGITTDYKQAKVTVAWTIKGDTREVFLVSNVIPVSIESDVGGGTLRVNVFDANNAPLPGASVRLINTTLVPNIDVTRTSDAGGIALFGGAPAGPNYEIIATAPGYSTDRTYAATTTLPNPNTLPIAILEADISTMNFFIDELSNATTTMLVSKVEEQYLEDFVDTTGLATTSQVTIAGGRVSLPGTVGTYAASGTVFTNEITPTPLRSWDYIITKATTTSNTFVRVRFYTGTSTPVLIPDADLPGNSAGFAPGLQMLGTLSTTAYPSVVLGMSLGTNSSNETPLLDRVTLGYTESTSVLSGVNATIKGSKTIGTDASSQPVYKTSLSLVTNSAGQFGLPNIEEDLYNITVSGYDIAAVCPINSLRINPGTNTTIEMLLRANTTNSLRTVVQDSYDNPVVGAIVVLSRSGFTDVKTTGMCGQVFFSGLGVASDYTIDVAADGYTSQSRIDVSIDGDEVEVFTL